MANLATVGLSAFAGAVNSNEPRRKTLALSLADPQSLNSYSYVENNPIKSTDPDGKYLTLALGAGLGAIALGVPEYFDQYARTGNVLLDSEGRKAVLGKAATGALAGAFLGAVQPEIAASIATHTPRFSRGGLRRRVPCRPKCSRPCGYPDLAEHPAHSLTSGQDAPLHRTRLPARRPTR
jgi:hypothetical protein